MFRPQRETYKRRISIVSEKALRLNCEKCQKEVFLPFKCPYCGGYYCSDHRLPENHDCEQLDAAKTQKQDASLMSLQQKPYEFTVSYRRTEFRKSRIRFTAKELGHLVVAAALVVGVGLSFFSIGQIYEAGPSVLAATITALTASFLLHEIAHKIVAQRTGLWAEFRLTIFGAALTLLSIFSPLFKIISPGAVMVSGGANSNDMGKVSIAGPMVNIVLCGTSLSLAALLIHNLIVFSVLMVIANLNAWIALFNVVPFAMLDGLKIFHWNKKAWILAFASSVALMACTYWLNMSVRQNIYI